MQKASQDVSHRVSWRLQASAWLEGDHSDRRHRLVWLVNRTQVRHCGDPDSSAESMKQCGRAHARARQSSPVCLSKFVSRSTCGMRETSGQGRAWSRTCMLHGGSRPKVRCIRSNQPAIVQKGQAGSSCNCMRHRVTRRHPQGLWWPPSKPCREFRARLLLFGSAALAGVSSVAFVLMSSPVHFQCPHTECWPPNQEPKSRACSVLPHGLFIVSAHDCLTHCSSWRSNEQELSTER